MTPPVVEPGISIAAFRSPVADDARHRLVAEAMARFVAVAETEAIASSQAAVSPNPARSQLAVAELVGLSASYRFGGHDQRCLKGVLQAQQDIFELTIRR